jgi:hypothetical protein
MGLFLDRLAFPDGAAPSRAELEAELRAQGVGTHGLEGYDVLPDGRAELRCMLDPATRSYALRWLLARGGVRIGISSSAPQPTALPWFVERPWPAWPWYRRWGVVLGFHGSLLATALPARERPR